MKLALAITLLTSSALMSEAPQQDKAKPTRPKEPTIHLSNPATLSKPNGYSHVAEVTGGKTVYIAGQVALDRSGNLVGKDDFRAQVQQVFENLKAAAESAGTDLHHAVQLNFFCAESVDASQLPVLREIRDRYIDPKNPPTSTLVFVKRLVRPEWMLEVNAVAVAKSE
jgi:enamine deaminase RidA (YjgF/YER057c/UK114 family)